MGEMWVKPIDGTELINTLCELLKEAHDKMDDFNAEHATYLCTWCGEHKGYDGMGLKHKDDCILVKIRKVINV